MLLLPGPIAGLQSQTAWRCVDLHASWLMRAPSQQGWMASRSHHAAHLLPVERYIDSILLLVAKEQLQAAAASTKGGLK